MLMKRLDYVSSYSGYRRLQQLHQLQVVTVSYMRFFLLISERDL